MRESSNRNYNLSFPSKVYLNEILNGWMRKYPNIPISIETNRLSYRMTLGYVEYDISTKSLKIYPAKEPYNNVSRQIVYFFRHKRPGFYGQWNLVKNETNKHLKNVCDFITKYIILPANKVIKNLTKEFPTFHEYNKDDLNENNYYVINNIRESIYREIQNLSSLGYKLDFFKIKDDENEVGNGYTYAKSNNKQVLEKFVSSMNDIIENKEALNEFRNLEKNKIKIEREVFIFKREIYIFFTKYNRI